MGRIIKSTYVKCITSETINNIDIEYTASRIIYNTNIEHIINGTHNNINADVNASRLNRLNKVIKNTDKKFNINRLGRASKITEKEIRVCELSLI